MDCLTFLILDWTQNIYHEGDFTTFPPDLAQLATQLAIISGYPRSKNFEAEAAIVNFYAPDSTLGGHLDESEFDVSAPIVSIRYIVVQTPNSAPRYFVWATTSGGVGVSFCDLARFPFSFSVFSLKEAQCSVTCCEYHF